MTDSRLEVQRMITASPAAIFAVLCDPQGHVAIDSSGMLMDADGEVVSAAGDSFVVHMDREALNDYPLGRYDVTVTITTFVPDREIAWTILGQIRPPIGHIYGYLLEPTADAPGQAGFFERKLSFLQQADTQRIQIGHEHGMALFCQAGSQGHCLLVNAHDCNLHCCPPRPTPGMHFPELLSQPSFQRTW